MPKSNIGYWRKKISGNEARDVEISKRYKSIGLRCLRIWEHQLKTQRALAKKADEIEKIAKERTR